MMTSTQKRIARLSGLLLLALLVVALAVPAAQAMRDFSSGTGGSSTSAGSGTGAAAQRSVGWAWGRAYADVAAARPLKLARIERIFSRKSRAESAPSVAAVTFAPATGAAPVSSGGSSPTVWIVTGSAAAALIVGIAAWALLRRRQPGVTASASYCAQHPEDSLCRAA